MNAQTQASKNALHKSLERRHNASTSLAALWRPALLQAFVKLDPRQLLRSPVMLVVELTAVLTTQLFHHTYLGGRLCDLPVYSS